MNEVIISKKEIESIWERDNLCFVKTKTGKVWLCNQYKDFTTLESELISGGYSISTKDYILENENDMVCLPLSQKGKSDRNG